MLNASLFLLDFQDPLGRHRNGHPVVWLHERRSAVRPACGSGGPGWIVSRSFDSGGCGSTEVMPNYQRSRSTFTVVQIHTFTWRQGSVPDHTGHWCRCPSGTPTQSITDQKLPDEYVFHQPGMRCLWFCGTTHEKKSTLCYTVKVKFTTFIPFVISWNFDWARTLWALELGSNQFFREKMELSEHTPCLISHRAIKPALGAWSGATCSIVCPQSPP